LPPGPHRPRTGGRELRRLPSVPSLARNSGRGSPPAARDRRSTRAGVNLSGQEGLRAGQARIYAKAPRPENPGVGRFTRWSGAQSDRRRILPAAHGPRANLPVPVL
jgi:hypothetical protein